MINKDTISGFLLLLLAGAYWHLTGQIPSSSLSDEVGADGLPRLLAIGLIIIAALIMIKGMTTKTVFQTGDDKDEAASPLRALGLVVIGVGYMVVAPMVGFALGIAALMIAVALYEGERLSLKVFAVALATGVGFWAVFVKGLGTDQPTAWLLQRFLGA